MSNDPELPQMGILDATCPVDRTAPEENCAVSPDICKSNPESDKMMRAKGTLSYIMPEVKNVFLSWCY